MLPALNLRREHVLFTWAGVRPLGADPGFPKGIRSREVHDLASDGMPGVYAMTAGPIMTHRSAGVEMAELVASKLKPSRARQPPSYAASRFPENRNSPALLDDYTAIKLSDLQFAAQNQHATNLIDLLFRRVGAGWTATMGYAAADKAAQAVAETMGWDRERTESEVREYRAHLERLYRVRPDQSAPMCSRDRERAAGSRSVRQPLSAVALEKTQRLLVELGDVLVDGSMRAALEDRQLAPADAVLHRFRETGGGDGVVAAEGDLGRGLDARERGRGIVGDHRIRLAHEGIERLCWTFAHEGGERLDIIRLRRVELRGEAPGKMP